MTTRDPPRTHHPINFNCKRKKKKPESPRTIAMTPYDSMVEMVPVLWHLEVHFFLMPLGLSREKVYPSRGSGWGSEYVIFIPGSLAGEMRWKLRAEALDFVSAKGLTDMSLSATTTTTTVIGPLCSSWKLEIAAENKDWEAHIFEIELYSGGDLISGPGMGTATSDCERSSAEGAFDGDTSTTWVTCSGAKVGKSVTYKLRSPNCHQDQCNPV